MLFAGKCSGILIGMTTPPIIINQANIAEVTYATKGRLTSEKRVETATTDDAYPLFLSNRAAKIAEIVAHGHAAERIVAYETEISIFKAFNAKTTAMGITSNLKMHTIYKLKFLSASRIFVSAR